MFRKYRIRKGVNLWWIERRIGLFSWDDTYEGFDRLEQAVAHVIVTLGQPSVNVARY